MIVQIIQIICYVELNMWYIVMLKKKDEVDHDGLDGSRHDGPAGRGERSVVGRRSSMQGSLESCKLCQTHCGVQVKMYALV